MRSFQRYPQGKVALKLQTSTVRRESGWRERVKCDTSAIVLQDGKEADEPGSH